MATVKRGQFPAASLHTEQVFFTVGAVGAGASALTTATTLSARDNYFSSCTRTSTGLFVVTVKELPGTILDVIPTLRNASGSTLNCKVRTWDTSAKTITIEVRDGASSNAVADPTTSDHIRLTVSAQLSSK